MRYIGLVLLIFPLLFGGLSAAQEVRSEHAYGDDGRYYHPTAIAGAADGSLFVAGTSTAPGLGGADPKFWLWKIDTNGKLVQQTLIAGGAKEDRINPSVEHVKNIILTDAGGALIVEFEMGHPHYVAFDPNAELTLTKRLEIPGRTRIYVQSLLAAGNGEILALGAADGRAFVLRIGAEGNIMWSARPAVADFFFNGAMQADGSFVAVGYSRANATQFSLTYFARDGSIRQNVTIDGRRASIAAANGGLALVYDRAADDGRDIHVVTVKNGNLTGDVAVPPFLHAPYRIVKAGDRHLIGATSEDDGVAVMVYEQGRITSLYESSPDAEPEHWSLEQLNGLPAVALTTTYTTAIPLTTKVGVIRFNEN